MSWFSRQKAPKPKLEDTSRVEIPEDTWTKCSGCSSLVYTKELRKNFGVCPQCDYHFRLKAQERIPILVDRHSFQEIGADIKPTDPLGFKDQKKYKDRLKAAEKKSNSSEAVITGRAKINKFPVLLGVFEFAFMGGSMGSVVGERLAQMIEVGIEEKTPVIIVSASGGARMQEGIFSLMQMAKVSAALGKLGQARVPYISVLTHPTTGGVAASFAMLGDVNLAEPGALIGFAGPRVIEQTIRQKLPKGFQTSEFLLEHGMVDRIVHRLNLREEISLILSNFGFGN